MVLLLKEVVGKWQFLAQEVECQGFSSESILRPSKAHLNIFSWSLVHPSFILHPDSLFIAGPPKKWQPSLEDRVVGLKKRRLSELSGTVLKPRRDHNRDFLTHT